MRSQKQSNRAPRPFKKNHAERGWSGNQGGFIPAPKFVHRPKKPSNTPPPESSGETSPAQ